MIGRFLLMAFQTQKERYGGQAGWWIVSEWITSARSVRRSFLKENLNSIKNPLKSGDWDNSKDFICVRRT